MSPDPGGVERARAYAKRLDAALAIVDKRRPTPNVAEVHHIIGEVAGRTALVVDDMHSRRIEIEAHELAAREKADELVSGR